jgi:acrylyl-CoA reductase (NADPH)
MTKFKALVTRENEDGSFSRKIEERTIDDLPQGDLLIKVKFSSLNFKDALSASGHKGITRDYPHTPGIDAAGIVESSASGKFKPGDEVIVTGYDLGMNTDGGFGEYIRVPSDWAVPLPEGLSLEESMHYGTAGFTAGICVYELIKHGIISGDKAVVSGATGGVGTIATGILAKLGLEVTASTGKKEAAGFLKIMGASEIISREELADTTGRHLLPGKWHAAIDCVGGNTLSMLSRSVKMHGSVCVLGNVAGDRFETSVYPFLLRGINLLGIDSASRSMSQRLHVWEMLSGEWKIENLADAVKIVSLGEMNSEIDNILEGKQIGRVVLKH